MGTKLPGAPDVLDISGGDDVTLRDGVTVAGGSV